jgi:hypothetical protein
VKTWNLRYVAFAASTGMQPEERLAIDKASRSYCMTGFILWIGERWVEWGGPRTTSRTREDHENFDNWLRAEHLARQQMELEFAS